MAAVLLVLEAAEVEPLAYNDVTFSGGFGHAPAGRFGADYWGRILLCNALWHSICQTTEDGLSDDWIGFFKENDWNV